MGSWSHWVVSRWTGPSGEGGGDRRYSGDGGGVTHTLHQRVSFCLFWGGEVAAFIVWF